MHLKTSLQLTRAAALSNNGSELANTAAGRSCWGVSVGGFTEASANVTKPRKCNVKHTEHTAIEKQRHLLTRSYAEDTSAYSKGQMSAVKVQFIQCVI